MAIDQPYAITISRQLGSGGSCLGQRLAARFGILYADREILTRAAKRLQVSEDSLVSYDERMAPMWDSILQGFTYGSPDICFTPPPLQIPADRDLQRIEAEIIEQVASECSSVIVGRGGFYILRNHPRHLSIFLHASYLFRRQRVQELYHVSAEDAEALITDTDRQRGQYLHNLTGIDWNDARQYHLSLDTSILGFDAAEEMVLVSLRARFGIEAINGQNK